MLLGQRQRRPMPTYHDLLLVAKDVTQTINGLDIQCCLMGSMACRVYGTSRLPNDIDVLCLNSPYDQEDLKRKLVQRNSKFYLVRAKDPAATYKVLWYRLYHATHFVSVKVDLLYPGILDIPKAPASGIDRSNVNRLPCMPLAHLLLLKLQGWAHHGESSRDWERLKQPADLQDISDLLTICQRRRVRPNDDPHIPTTFKTISQSRIVRYIEERPESRSVWSELGFAVYNYGAYD